MVLRTIKWWGDRPFRDTWTSAPTSASRGPFARPRRAALALLEQNAGGRQPAPTSQNPGSRHAAVCTSDETLDF